MEASASSAVLGEPASTLGAAQVATATSFSGRNGDRRTGRLPDRIGFVRLGIAPNNAGVRAVFGS